MNDLRNLNLTDDDFKLIIEGLECLPNKGLSGELMIDVIGSMVIKGDEEVQRKFEAEREKDRAERDKIKEALKDDIRILQGKLLVFKKFLKENRLLTKNPSSLN